MSEIFNKDTILDLKKIITITFLFMCCSQAFSEDLNEIYKKGTEALEAWDLSEATKYFNEIGKRDNSENIYNFFGAELLLNKGDYNGAYEHLQRINFPTAEPKLPPLKKVIENYYKCWKDKERKEETTYFTIRFVEDNDKILAYYLKNHLDKVFERLTARFDFKPKGEKLILEIYPTLDSFIAVSTLSRKAIKTSGTIALCKWNRMLIVSPRNLFRGYRWLDTIAHEFIHYLISTKSRNTIPIWFHEGLARYNEEYWNKDKIILSKRTESTLYEMVKNRSFVQFKKMHPSMALLDSAYESTRAFTEVFMAIYMIEKTRGYSTINKILEDSKVVGFDKAFEKNLKENVPNFEKQLINYISSLKFKQLITDTTETITFVDEKENKKDDEIPVKAAKVKDFIHLGDLLRLKAQSRAACIEYEKANDLLKNKSEFLLTKLANTWNEIGDRNKTLEYAMKAHELESYSPHIYHLLGFSYLDKKEYEKALYFLEEGLLVNPFHPLIHKELATVYEKLGKTKESEVENGFFKLLTGG